MEEGKDTCMLTDNEISSQGLPECDVAGQEHNKWSELASLPPDSLSKTAVEMTERGTAYIADGKMNSQAAAKHKSSARSVKTRLRCFEVLILTPVMLVIIGLFLLPTVFYALPSQQQQIVNRTEGDCLNVVTYSGEVCRITLASLQTCFSGVTSPPPALNIPSLIDQQTGERDATRLVNGLTLLNPSPQCGEVIIPFLCLSIFALCDSSNHLHTILRGDCLELRDNICAEEWSQAIGFLGAGVLPICEDLPDTSDECIGSADNSSLPPPSTNTSHLDANQATPSPGNQTASGDQLVCSEGFFFDENVTNLCRPTCGEFNATPLSHQIIRRFTIPVCFIASVIMFILALTVQRKKLLVFPSILFVYMCITTFLASVVLMVGFFDNVALFCGSRDLLNTIEKGNETPFCIISGFIFTYCLEQISMWAALHATFLFWAVRYPYSYRRLRISGRIRYAHIISVLLGVFLPMLGPCVLLRDGFRTTSTPSLVCTGRNLDFNYYTITLPVSFLVGVTSCLLVLLFWTLFKEFMLKNWLAKTKVGKVWKTQFKISAIIIYYTFLGVVGLIGYTYQSTSDTYREGIAEYILCESGGQSDCVLDLGINGDLVHVLTTTIIVMLSLLPVLAILFSCNPQACSKKNKSTTFVRSTTSQVQR